MVGAVGAVYASSVIVLDEEDSTTAAAEKKKKKTTITSVVEGEHAKVIMIANKIFFLKTNCPYYSLVYIETDCCLFIEPVVFVAILVLIKDDMIEWNKRRKTN